mmetsp:Transcript_23029/g.22374  ORF Transcript_23029/g.22374 Transcript_23029/m.22374 type:complete len:111 (+) Transcript_23029:698-1030(+)
MSNFNQDLKQYSTTFIDADNLEVSKKRKNAVQQIVRFICQNERTLVDPPIELNGIDLMYRQVFYFLQKGDVNSALHLLNQNKKTKMALYVSQSFNNRAFKDILANEYRAN